jgi:hypothetical protein
MAYVAPTTRANSFVPDAVRWNQDIVENFIQMKALLEAQNKMAIIHAYQPGVAMTNLAWNIVDLSNVVLDDYGIIDSISSGRVKLLTGSYEMQAFAAPYASRTNTSMVMQLYNITDSNTVWRTNGNYSGGNEADYHSHIMSFDSAGGVDVNHGGGFEEFELQIYPTSSHNRYFGYNREIESLLDDRGRASAYIVIKQTD